MDIRIRESNNISIVDIDGQIDINSSEIIEAVGWLVKNQKKDILLNLDKVNMVDYSGISILAIAYKNVVNHKGKMKFCNVPLHVEGLFKLVRLDNIFEIYNDESSAINTFYRESGVDRTVLRRRFKRLGVQAEIEFRAENEVDKTWREGKILNISGEGLFVHAKSILPLGAKVALRLNLFSGKIIEAEGAVVWLADKSLQPQSYPGMGIHFKDMTKEIQDEIIAFINKNITNRSIND